MISAHLSLGIRVFLLSDVFGPTGSQDCLRASSGDLCGAKLSKNTTASSDTIVPGNINRIKWEVKS